MRTKFYNSHHGDIEVIVAGLNDGSIEFFCTDADRVRWYKSTDIHAVTPARAIHASEADIDPNDEVPNVITCEPFASDAELDDLISREAAGEIRQIGADKWGRTFFIECEADDE